MKNLESKGIDSRLSDGSYQGENKENGKRKKSKNKESLPKELAVSGINAKSTFWADLLLKLMRTLSAL